MIEFEKRAMITRLKELDLFDKRPIEEYLSTFRSGGELA